MSQDHIDYVCNADECDFDGEVHVVSYGYHGEKVYCPECGARMESENE
jgi:UDP-N-acetylmuramyl tripeptide synthase